MKLLRLNIFLLLFLFVLFFPFSMDGGIFTDMLLSPNNGEHISSVPSTTAIFQKNLGAANPVQWARKLPSTGNTERFLSSTTWKNTRNDFLKNYGHSSKVRQYLEYLFRVAIRVNNIASSRSVNIKGDLGESIMDCFYIKDGWEKLDGKRGRNGFDGLYVKRTASGRIYDYLPAESKTGSSRPGRTQHGIQGSREWVKHNISELLKCAKEDYQKHPSPLTKKRFDDLSQIAKLQGRETHFHKFHIVKANGKVCVSYDILSSDFSTIKRSQLIDMQTNGKMQQLIYKKLEQEISKYISPQKTARLVKKIERRFKRGIIKNKSDFYCILKRGISDKKLVRAVAQELGEELPRGSLAGALGKRISKNSGIIISATVVAGFIIAHDAMKDGITSDTFIKAGIASSTTLVTSVALDYGMNIAARFASEQIARYVLSQSGKRVTETVPNFAGKLAPTVSQALGGTLQVAFALYFIGDTIYNYNMGNMTQTDMLVNVSIVALTTAGTVFFTCTKAGAAVGTMICPGFGTAAGSFIGAAIGILGGTTTGGYMWYVEKQRQEQLLADARGLAEWETINNKKRLSVRIQELEKEADQLSKEAWQGLLKID